VTASQDCAIQSAEGPRQIQGQSSSRAQDQSGEGLALAHIKGKSLVCARHRGRG